MVDEAPLEEDLTTQDIKDLLTSIFDELVLQKAILNDIKTNTGV